MSVFLLCVVVTSFQSTFAQGPQPPPLPPDGSPGARLSLNALTHALAAAGAPALTSDQEEQLTTLMTAFREAQRPERPDPATNPRSAYDEAIVAGNLAAAQDQASVIAGHVADRVEKNLESEADFKIQALGVLTEEQQTALLRRTGTVGVSLILNSLIGRIPGGFGGIPGGCEGGRRPFGQGDHPKPRG